jgi:hypothetical protein
VPLASGPRQLGQSEGSAAKAGEERTQAAEKSMAFRMARIGPDR